MRARPSAATLRAWAEPAMEGGISRTHLTGVLPTLPWEVRRAYRSAQESTQTMFHTGAGVLGVVGASGQAMLGHGRLTAGGLWLGAGLALVMGMLGVAAGRVGKRRAQRSAYKELWETPMAGNARQLQTLQLSIELRPEPAALRLAEQLAPSFTGTPSQLARASRAATQDALADA